MFIPAYPNVRHYQHCRIPKVGTTPIAFRCQTEIKKHHNWIKMKRNTWRLWRLKCSLTARPRLPSESLQNKEQRWTTRSLVKISPTSLCPCCIWSLFLKKTGSRRWFVRRDLSRPWPWLVKAAADSGGPNTQDPKPLSLSLAGLEDPWEVSVPKSAQFIIQNLENVASSRDNVHLFPLFWSHRPGLPGAPRLPMAIASACPLNAADGCATLLRCYCTAAKSPASVGAVPLLFHVQLH